MSEGMLQLIVGQILANQAAILLALSKNEEGATREMLASHKEATDKVLNVLNGVSSAGGQRN
jgi:hypothetical protein